MVDVESRKSTPGTETIGWVGVGAMGLPICANLITNGHRVVAYDHSPDRMKLAAHIGAEVVASAREVAERADIVFSMVYDDAALERVVTAADGLLAGFRPGMLYVDMSTVSPALSGEMAALLKHQSVRYLRAPVSGSVGMASTATLSVLVSGDAQDLAACRSILASISSAQTYVGPDEAARVIKLAINMLVVSSTVLIGEALSFGEKGGVPRATLVQALNQSIVGSRHYEARAESLATRRYGTAGPVRLAEKDLSLALSIAAGQDFRLPMTQQVYRSVVAAINAGHSETEVTVLAEQEYSTRSSP